MKKSHFLILSVLVIAGILTGGLRWNSQQRTTRTIEAHLLASPSVNSLKPELAQRIVELNERAVSGPERVDALATLSRLYHANGYINHAWQTYRILIEIDKNNPLWPHRLGTIVSGLGQLDDAVALFKQAIHLDSEHIPTSIYLGDTLLKLNRYTEAKVVYQSVLDTDSTNPFALFGLARVSIAQTDLKRAKYILESARRSNNRIGGDLLADIYETLGETSKARTLLHAITWSSHVSIPDPWVDEMVSDCYDSFEVAMAAGKAGRAGDLPRAIQLMEKSLTLDPLDHYAHDHLAKLYLSQSDPNQARSSYENCTKVLPTYDQGWAGLISIEIKLGKQAKASGLIDQALFHCPNSPVINNYKGEFLLNNNRTQEAIPYFKTAIRNKPQHATGYTYLASAYLKIGQNEKALEQLKEALKADPSNPLALKLTTIFYVLAGDSAQAETFLERAIASPRISEDVIGQLQAMFKNRFQ